MVLYAPRESYFGLTETDWYICPMYDYKDIRFIMWVYQIDGVAYTFGSPEFKDKYEKAQAWEKLKA